MDTYERNVLNAWTNPGTHPHIHEDAKYRLHRDWPALAYAIDELVDSRKKYDQVNKTLDEKRAPKITISKEELTTNHPDMLSVLREEIRRLMVGTDTNQFGVTLNTWKEYRDSEQKTARRIISFEDWRNEGPQGEIQV